jgi:hypothetical protein
MSKRVFVKEEKGGLNKKRKVKKKKRKFPCKQMDWEEELEKKLFHADQDPDGIWGYYRFLLITGTGVSKAINLNKWSRIEDYFRDRKGLMEYNRFISEEEHKRMEEGIRKEPTARFHYCKEMKKKVIVKGIAIDTENKWLGHSGDGYVLDGDNETDDIKSVYDKNAIGIIEIKCPQRAYTEISREYIIQMQTGMIVHKKDWCDFVVYTTPIDKYRRMKQHISITRVSRSNEYCKLIMVRLNYFMDCLQHNVLPSVDFIPSLTKEELPDVKTEELINKFI